MKFITLQSEDVHLLQEMELKTISKPLRNRIQCILLSHKGVKVKELVTYFGVTKKTIYQWLNLWEQQGLSGLIHKSGTGRKSKLRNIPTASIKEIVREFPSNLKPAIAKIKEIYNVEVSKKTVQRFLKTSPI